MARGKYPRKFVKRYKRIMGGSKNKIAYLIDTGSQKEDLSADRPKLPWHGYLKEDDETLAIYQGLRPNKLKQVLFYFLATISVGLVYVITYWKPKWRSKFTHSVCRFENLDNASCVLVEDQYGQVELIEIKSINNKMKNESDEFDHYFKGQEEAKNTELSAEWDDDATPLIMRTKKFAGSSGLQGLRYFEYHHHRYFWNERKHCFDVITSVDKYRSFQDAYKMSNGLSEEEKHWKLKIFAENKIDVLVKSYLRLFFEEAADPFYVFQLFSCILWFFDDYYYYSATIIFISLVSISVSMYQTRNHLVALRNMIAKSELVTVLRSDGKEEVILSENLVPGDILVIPPHGCDMHCDAVLLSGTAIVNESMLTGESVPILKTPLPHPPSNKPELNEVINSVKHKRHFLYCGTRVMQTRFYDKGKVLAYVFKTGYYTTKGNLIRSILFPKPIGYQFFSDAMKFVGVLGIFAFCGFIYTCYVFKEKGAQIGEIALRALDVITIAVPPALPAAMTVGTIYALQRLKKSQIYCTSPSRINISGKLKLFCFDKTGTLTENGLDYFGTILVDSGKFTEYHRDVSHLIDSKGIHCMATCHSLTVIDGKLTGDPLELNMFEATGWELDELSILEETERYESLIPTVVRPSNNIKSLNKDEIELAILKQFTFSSELQRSSVIVRRLGKPNMDVFVKGSPEMICSLCREETIPKDFNSVLKRYAEEGFRIIALASKSLGNSMKWHHVQQAIRTDVERELEFQGFLILKNMVKKETMRTIKALQQSCIRVVMITGDNLLTAMSVGKECKIVLPSEALVQVSAIKINESDDPEIRYSFHSDVSPCNFYPHAKPPVNIFDFRSRGYHFILNGKSFALIRTYKPELYKRILVCGTIFARMLPDQKAQLVEDLQGIGYTVGMCGDGANDCGALKVAHAGVSLSEAEASIASPFTSKHPDISCVLEIIKEGRCALVTSFTLFKYMALYSMVQYMSVLMLYSVRSNLGDLQYLYIDLFIIMPFAVTMSRTGAYHEIVPRRPLGSLVHPVILTSLILQILTQLAFQITIFLYIKTKDYYKSTNWFHVNTPHKKGETQILSYENTVLFYMSSFQYIFLAVAFSIGKPYRGKIYKNVLFLIALVSLTGFTVLLVLYPVGILLELFQLIKIEDRYFILSFFLWVCSNAVLSFAIEAFIVKSENFRAFLNFLRRKKRKKNPYKHITMEMNIDSNWPPTQPSS